VILAIVNEAYLLPFILTEDGVTFGEAYSSDLWEGADSAVEIVGTGENDFSGEFTVYYNRFDLSTLTAPLEVIVNEETTLEDVKESIALYLNAFAEELTFDVDVIPTLTDGESTVINLLAVEGSTAYYGSTPVTLTFDSLDDIRLMEDGSIRLMEDGTARLLEG
jgi:hypothetical protein